MYAGDRAVVHLTLATDGAATQPAGVFNHLAFDCDGLAGTRARLDAAGLAYEMDGVDALRQVQLFLTDLAGIGVELTFSSAANTA